MKINHTLSRALLAACLAFPAVMTAHAEAAAPPMHAQPSDPILTLRVDGGIVVARDGSLVSYTRATELPATIAAKVDAQVKQWKFNVADFPATANQARARMRITLAAEPQGAEAYAVRIDNVTFPGGTGQTKVGTQHDFDDVSIKVKKLGGVRYPESMRNSSVEAIVLLQMRLDASGDVVEVLATQTSLLNVRGTPNELGKAIAAFEKVTERGARQWRFDVTSKGPAPTSDDLTVNVPVMFSFKTPEKAGVWRSEVRSPKRQAPWLSQDALVAALGVSDIADGEVLTSSSAVRLATSVNGRLL